MPTLELAPWQVLALSQPFEHFCLYGGVGTGKSFTGANWSIQRIMERPDVRGFVGANTHTQLSQVTLQEFYYWLSEYRVSYVINSIPPPSWQPRLFADYSGITTVRTPAGKVTNVFTRVLSKGDNLRGLEFGWYWIDETRDTPEYTHDVILARMRDAKDYRRGLVTTTTNSKDWTWRRFVQGAKANSRLYGSAHVSTRDSVKYAIVSEEYLATLLATYSPLMALQEIDAKHVNVWGGKAYHGWQEDCARRRAPWGDRYPNPDRPLIVGCDFNFSPAPCVWVFGQTGPDLSGPRPGTGGPDWSRHIHWFGEIQMTEASTETMTTALIMRCPDFYYQVFGDSSGTKGTTSNAGETDYAQMAGVFDDHGVGYAIDADQANPRVKDRVESMNAMLTNAIGQHRMTYDPDACPRLHQDFEVVGWSKSGKLEGDSELDTHASDGAGYAIYKLFGPHSFLELEPSVPSIYR